MSATIDRPSSNAPTPGAPLAGEPVYTVPAEDSPTIKSADRLLIIGAIVCGTIALAPIGVIIIGIGVKRISDARRRGEFARPSAVTVFGVFSAVDCMLNFLGWSFDIWAHNTLLIQWVFEGWGRLFDGGYYLDYNSNWSGGAAGAGEKSWQFFCIFGVYPARMIAAWGFLKLKRWGYRWMIITSWVYVIQWLAYLVNMCVNFPDRFGATQYGVTGYWLYNIWYITPFLMLPWIYALDKRRWCR